MTRRRIDGFFYGMFMDAKVLHENNVSAVNPRRCYVNDFALRIGERATLVPSAGARAYGMTYALTHDEIERLYSAPGLQAYRPEAVLAQLEDKLVVPAICYNLTTPPDPDEINHQYAERLKGALTALGFPTEYVNSVK
jgi:Holliday junction resolvasome RuvABC DNA-binding subunit